MKIHSKSTILSATVSAICCTLLSSSPSYAAALIDPATEPASISAPYALSDTDLSSGTEKAFRPWFENGSWQGDLVQYDISTTGGLSTTVDLSTSPPTNSGSNWSARLQFDAAATADSTFWTSSRKIITSTTGTDQTAFRWANLTAAQQTSIDSVAQAAAAASSDIFDFIRGDRSNETDATPAGPYRKRYSLLGDIIHSTAVYVGAPAASFSLPGYSDYKTKLITGSPSGQKDRTPIVYVGANDGMLHAFNAATGNEEFAYVPSMVFSKLSKLTAASYVHTYFVDGELSVGDADLGASPLVDWHTLLVGGLGSGGKGLFALDVTHAGISSEASATGNDKKILWEKTGDDYGYIHGKAQIALLNDSNWHIIQGNGYSSVNDVAKLLLISPDGTTVATIATDATTGNGLSSPALVDMNNDSKPDFAYAGDLKGNMWKFDLTNKTSFKLFNVGVNQPITIAPDIARHPSGGVIVYFGTGSLLSGPNTAGADTSDTNSQAFYGIWDNNATAQIANDSNILVQPLTEQDYAAGTTIRYSTNNTAINWSTNTGWKVTFPTAGERLVGDPQLRAGRLQFITTSFAADKQPVAWIMELNYLNGGSNNNVIFDLNGDAIRDGVDSVNRPVDANGDPIGTGNIPVAVKYGSYGIFSQPTIARIDNNADTLLVNGLLMPIAAACSGNCSEGFIGGHMDIDTDSPYGGTEAQRDSSPNSGSDTDGHQHEYDKEHGAVFADWFDLEPRRGLFTLNVAKTTSSLPSKLNRIEETCDPNIAGTDNPCKSTTPASKRLGGDATSKAREFFVILANADLSPGGIITIGNKTWPVVEYQDLVSKIILGLGNRDVSSTGLAADHNAMVDADGDSLIFSIDSIKAKTRIDDTGATVPGTLRIDFDNRAIIEGRLHATIPGCEWGSSDPYAKGTNPLRSSDDAHITNAQENKVTGYRWRNGALTMQLVDAANYKLQPRADTAHDKFDANNPVGGTHVFNYTQTGFADSGAKITAGQQVNAGGVIESGLLYEGSIFNHWGALYETRTGQTARCYGHSTYQTSVSIEQAGLTLGEYNTYTSKFANDPALQTAFAAALAAYEAATSEADLASTKAALVKIVNDNGLQKYMKYRTYVRGKIPASKLLPWDKVFTTSDTPGTTGPAEVQDATKDDDQLGQNFRTGRRTWIDLTP